MSGSGTEKAVKVREEPSLVMWNWRPGMEVSTVTAGLRVRVLAVRRPFVPLRERRQQCPAMAIKSLKISGNVAGSTITLTGTVAALGKLAALGSLTVTGNVSDSNIIAIGNVGTVSVGGMAGSKLFAGIALGITGLPTTGDFANNATIASFTVTGKSPFAGSDIAAAAIGAVTLNNVITNDGGISVGVATKSLKSFTLQQPNQKPFTWTAKQSPAILSGMPGDLKVQLL